MKKQPEWQLEVWLAPGVGPWTLNVDDSVSIIPVDIKQINNQGSQPSLKLTYRLATMEKVTDVKTELLSRGPIINMRLTVYNH